MGRNCVLATLDEDGAHAYWLGTGVLITARGTVPESCWKVKIKQNLLTVHPPEYVLERCRAADVCLPVVTPYSTAREFELGTKPEHIVLHHDGGRTDVPVDEDIPTALEPIITEAAIAADVEAVGISFAFSFEEALDSALSKLAGEPSNVPVDATVESITAGRGGIIGPYIAVTVKKA